MTVYTSGLAEMANKPQKRMETVAVIGEEAAANSEEQSATVAEIVSAIQEINEMAEEMRREIDVFRV